MTRKSQIIAYYATLIALIFIALMLDTVVGSFLPVKPAIFSLPTVFMFALLHGDVKNSLIAGAIFGLMSFARAFITGSIPFQNPLISILPRLIVGAVVFAAYLLGKKIFAKCSKGETLALGFASALGMITNTVTVVFSMYFFGDGTTITQVFGMIMSINAPIELVTATVLTPVIVQGVRRGLKITVPQKQTKKEIEHEQQ